MAVDEPPVREKRAHKASSRLGGDNEGDLELHSHRAAREEQNRKEKEKADREKEAATAEKAKGSSSKSVTTAAAIASSSASTTNKRKPVGVGEIRDSDEEVEEVPPPKKKKISRKASALSTPTENDAVVDANDNENNDDNSSSDDDNKKPTIQDKTKDITAFFDNPVTVGGKKKRRCKLCIKSGHHKDLVSEVSTLRRHLQSNHAGKYRKWCTENDFVSKLPHDVAQRKEDADKLRQSALDPHLRERTEPERVVKYSNDQFRQAAVEWLIATDQPIQALEHPAFKSMIAIAARATDGVKIPSGKATRKYIMEQFKKNLTDLRRRLSSDAVRGKVSLTCDAWQASNADAYLACTGHWIENVNGKWVLQSVLLGFTQMNSAHDGVRLGRALYRIVVRLKIAHKIGWVTCDNASNNGTMLAHFATRLNASEARKGMKEWEWKAHYIRCLAHVINLATQALLAAYSKAKYYEPGTFEIDDDFGIPGVEGVWRDEIGLIRAIAVKVRSSAQRKALFKSLQELTNLMLPGDMRVRWSSTYIMLKRAFDLQDAVNAFVFKIINSEKDATKKRKLTQLTLTHEEWERVKLVLRTLKEADDVQQKFSSETEATLCHGIPALERLYDQWSERAERKKYSHMAPAIRAGLAKVADYYDKTGASYAYTFSMILNPSHKMKHFEEHWDAALQKKVLDSVQKIFRERWEEVYGPGGERAASLKQPASNSNDSSGDEDDSPRRSRKAQPAASAPSTPKWLADFNAYIQAADVLPPGMLLAEWWGLHSSREGFTVWSLLALDYLPIMASSVSSERAFSSAGITISKRRNRLKADIVESLQFLKWSIRRDLLYREPEPTSVLELEDIEEQDGDVGHVSDDFDIPTDMLLRLDDDDDDEETNSIIYDNFDDFMNST